jgi:quercetin dioxygenase-like cupin family protein
MPHSHPEATEIAFIAQGSMEIETGGAKRIYNAGDFLLMPPEIYHDYWFKGDDPVCLFVAVAPNHKDRRWLTSDWPPQAHQGDAPHANAFESDDLPSDQFFRNEKITLPPGEVDLLTDLPLQDRIIYVLSGTATATVNQLSGPVSAHQYLYIPATYPHLIRNRGYEPLVYISMIVTDPATAGGTELTE